MNKNLKDLARRTGDKNLKIQIPKSQEGLCFIIETANSDEIMQKAVMAGVRETVDYAQMKNDRVYSALGLTMSNQFSEWHPIEDIKKVYSVTDNTILRKDMADLSGILDFLEPGNYAVLAVVDFFFSLGTFDLPTKLRQLQAGGQTVGVVYLGNHDDVRTTLNDFPYHYIANNPDIVPSYMGDFVGKLK